ncbi:MAG: endo-alpha-N-acetylgalactosaminidase family protein [Armatimonadota bacterium]
MCIRSVWLLVSILSVGMCMTQPLQAAFKPKLLAVEIDRQIIRPGDTIRVSYWWQNVGDSPSLSDYRVFVHLRANLDDSGWSGGGDYAPSIPTHRWNAGRVVIEQQLLNISGDFPSGSYYLLVGMFSPDDGSRLEIGNPDLARGQSRYEVCRLRVGGQEPSQKRIELSPAVRMPAQTIGAGNMNNQSGFTLQNSKCSVTLDSKLPRVIEYKIAGSSGSLTGGTSSDEPDIRVYSRSIDKAVWAQAAGYKIRYAPVHSNNQVVYRISVFNGDKPAVEFDLRYKLSGSELQVGFDNVKEHPGYELMDLRMPALVCVRGSEPNANLAITTHSGRRIPVAECPPHEMVHPANWFNPAPMGMVYSDSILGMLTVPSVDDRLVSMINEYGPDMRCGGLAVEFTHRLGVGGKSPRFIAQPSSSCSIKLVGDQNHDGVCDWTDGAVLWNKQVKTKLNPLYKNTLIYKIFLDFPGIENPTTFDDALRIIQRINRLTDGAPQVAYLVGWQHQGHDTGYPDVFTANQRIGGMERLRALVESAKKLNCIVSFHDNYDDAYMDGPGWNPDIIARDKNGDLMKGGFWGHQSYSIGHAQYARTTAAERVRRTLEMYPIEKTYHIDVLSAVPAVYDFRPDHPAGAAENLKGKWFILDEFKRHGVDVTSEGLTDQFVEKVNHFWHLMRSRDQVYPLEYRIPLVPFMYHGKVTWGGGNSPEVPPVMDALYYGATYGCDLTKESPDSLLTDIYYLTALPASLLRSLPATGYKESGDTKTIYYGKDTFAEINESAKRYHVVYKGRVVAKDFSVCVPVSARKSLVYSRSSGEISYPVPDGWANAESVSAYDLLTGIPAQVDAKIESGIISLHVTGGHPYRITYAPVK